MLGKLRFLLPVVLTTVLATFFIVSASAGGMPSIPSPPYIPKSPEEDILMVEAYLEQGAPGDANSLYLKLMFASPTPPAGQGLWILVTLLLGSPSHETAWVSTRRVDPPTTTHNLIMPLPLGGSPVLIAVYAWLDTSNTDRAPNTGFYEVNVFSPGRRIPASNPNRFWDYDNVGGVVLPTNTHMIIAPCLMLVGLAATTAAAAVKKRRN